MPGRLLKLFVLSFLLMVSAVHAETLVIAQGQDVTLLNPMKTTAQVELNVGRQIVESLVVLGHDQQTILPKLAVSWERLDDHRVQFDLREGVYFSNGEAFDAEAARFSLELGAQEPAMSGMLSTIESVEVVDQYTIIVHTKTPDPLLELSFARSSYMLPPAYFQEVGEDGFNAHPIGTGPYLFSERVSGQYVALQANPDYWGEAPGIEHVRFRGIQEDGARMAALQTGEVHLATNLPLAFIPRIEASAGIQPVTVGGARIYLLILDSRSDDTPVYNKLVRQAINYAIDKEALLDVLFEGRGVIVDGQQATKEFFGYHPDLEAYPYDPERARELLAEAGHPNGFEVRFTYPFGRLAADKEVSEAIAAMLADVGIQTQQVILESGEYLNQLLTQKLGPLALAGYATAPDAHYQYNINTEGERYTYYANPAYDDLVKKAASETDRAAREALYLEAAELAHDDPPYAFLFAPDDLYGVSDKLQGWNPRADQWIVLDGTRLE